MGVCKSVQNPKNSSKNVSATSKGQNSKNDDSGDKQNKYFLYIN